MKEKYKYFIVTKLIASQYTSNCILASWAISKHASVPLSINQEYMIASDNDGFNYSYITVQSTTGTRCSYTIVFYN